MNLLELIAKNDPNVQVEVWNPGTAAWGPHDKPASLISKISRPRIAVTGVIPSLAMDTVRGLQLKSGMRVVVKNAGLYWPNYVEGHGSFKFCSAGGSDVAAVVGWSSGDHDNLALHTEFLADSKLTDKFVPPMTANAVDLVISIPIQKGAKLFFGVHRLLDRNELFSRCTGLGVEIGPGPKPQILPSGRTRVKYVEQATPDQWQLLYGKDTAAPINPDLWELYVVGNADNIPVERHSLDFIFSSHVVEHLANPLGHFAYWSSLLSEGGIVAAVIPDHGGCKDYIFQPSTYEELVAEFHNGSMTPTLAHYQRWAKYRAPRTDPADILRSGRSIHVHFYTPDSMDTILLRMHKQLGFSRYSITSEKNHKDFFVVLEK